MFTVISALADMDCNIITIENGKQAVKMAAKVKPGFILMDMQPEMSGMEATKLIKSNHDLTGMPIVAITANVMRGYREKTLAAGCMIICLSRSIRKSYKKLSVNGRGINHREL